MKVMSAASLGDDLGAKLNCVNNPESYMLFSLSAYLYQNAPDGMDPMIFLKGGLPVFEKHA